MLKNVELRDYQKKILNDLKYVPAVGLFMKTGCVDKDTEYFNGKQWKKICDYVEGESVLQFDKGTGCAYLDKPLEYIKEKEDSLNLIKTKYGVNQCLSNEHTMLFVNSHTNKLFTMKFSDFEEKHNELKLGFYHKIPTTFKYCGNGIDLTDTEILIMLAVICDGSFSKSNTNFCRLNLKKERKINEIIDILNNGAIKYKKKMNNKTDYTSIYFKAPRKEKEFEDYWYNCNEHQLKLITDNICKWDGSFSKGRQTFSNTSRKTIDFIQFAFTCVGKRASISIDNRVDRVHKNICYTLNISDRKNVSIINSNVDNKLKIQHYKTLDGYKYCFRTKTGYLVLRREGKIFVTGNSGKTITSLARFEQNKTKNLLVICPQKIITQWWEVLEKHTDLKPLRYKLDMSAKNKNKLFEQYLDYEDVTPNCIVVNFDILDKITCLDKYIDNNWTIIIDESHKIKNVGSYRHPVKTTKRCLELGEKTLYKIILTATPTEKENGGYIDLYSQLKFLGYIDYNDTYFKNNFCIIDKFQVVGMPFPIKKIIGYRMDRINEQLKPILNATCRYYAPKYGDYEPQKIKVEIPRAKSYSKLLRERVYREIVFDNVSAMRVAKKSLIGGIITGTNEYGERFSYDDNSEKADWLEEFLSNTDEVVSVLYCYNVEKEKIIGVCKKLKKKYIVINGEVKDKPAELKKEFDVIIGQYQAFSESLDGLQYKCHLMVFYSMPDSSLSYKQSLGRIDRIGQEKVPTYYHLIMNSTIDESIYTMLKNKIEFSEKELNELEV